MGHIALSRVSLLATKMFIFVAISTSAISVDSNFSAKIPNADAVRRVRSAIYTSGDEWRRLAKEPETVTFQLNTLYYLSEMFRDLDRIRSESPDEQVRLFGLSQFAGYPKIAEHFLKLAKIKRSANSLNELAVYQQRMVIASQNRLLKNLSVRESSDIEWVLADFARNGIDRRDLYAEEIVGYRKGSVRQIALESLVTWRMRRDKRSFDIRDFNKTKAWIESRDGEIQTKVSQYRQKGAEDYVKVAVYPVSGRAPQPNALTSDQKNTQSDSAVLGATAKLPSREALKSGNARLQGKWIIALYLLGLAFVMVIVGVLVGHRRKRNKEIEK